VTLKKIEAEQAMANIKFETAKKMAALLAEAREQYKKLGGDTDGWNDEMEQIQRLVFEDE